METQSALVEFANENIGLSCQRVPMIGETVVVRDETYTVKGVRHEKGNAYLDVGGGDAPEKEPTKPFRIPVSWP